MKGPRVLLCMALLALAAGAAASPGYGEGGPSESKKEFERIKREMNEKKKEIKRAKSREHSVLAALERIDREILAGSAELAGQRKRLEEAEAAERDIETSSDRLVRELAVLKGRYAVRLRALYKMSRSGAMIDPSGGLGSLVKQVKYLSLIAERDRTIIRDYGGTLIRLRMQQASLVQRKEDILQRRRAVEAKKTELEAKRRQKSSILADVRQQKGLHEQTLRELEDASVSLWAMVRTEEGERRSSAAAQKPAAGFHEGGTAGDNRRLPWPVEGQLLTRFGMQRHPQFGTMVFRRGIEIEAREGQAVRAVEGGQAAYADWYRGYGKLVILDHGNGFYTLYGNLSKLELKKGDRVSRGQAVGLAGETGSLKGAKLYFEIRRRGEAEDPLLWLAKK